MKRFTPNQFALLKQLADGRCYSGTRLGQSLTMSRTAVWKHIHQLIQLGAPIQHIPQRGYQLNSPIEWLDDSIILKHLQAKSFRQQPIIHLFASIDSTNQFLKTWPSSKTWDVCCAETQTQGRGRLGRHWQSPFGENIYCSTRIELSVCPSRLAALGLVVGLSLLAAMKDSGIHEPLQLKWPNDLLWNDKKLSGILIELSAETNGFTQLIIGIGLNVNTVTHEHPMPGKPWCSLYEMTAQYHDRNLILANLLIQLDNYLERFLHHGFDPFKSEWEKTDYLYGKAITVSNPSGLIHGMAQGVNALGQLILQDEKGHLHQLSSGDASIAKITPMN